MSKRFEPSRVSARVKAGASVGRSRPSEARNRAAAWVAVAIALSGCLAGSGGNPNLLAPKLVVQPRGDGNVTIFVHGAFREQLYDWISLGVDNQSVENLTQAFSLERVVDSDGFFVDVRAFTNDQLYEAKARLDVNWTAERVLVATLGLDGEWRDARPFSLPYEHVLDRPRVGP